jgi:hypothetical protein
MCELCTVGLTDSSAAVGCFQWDWETRHWQYIENEHDRYTVSGSLPRNPTITEFDIINFRDHQVRTDCPLLHYQAESKYLDCVALYDAQEYVDLTPQLNSLRRMQSYARAQSTALYEACLVSHPVFTDIWCVCVCVRVCVFPT